MCECVIGCMFSIRSCVFVHECVSADVYGYGSVVMYECESVNRRACGVCVSRVFTMSYAVVFPCVVVCHDCSRSWKTIPNRCIPQILQDIFVSEIKQEVDLTRDGHTPERSKQAQVDNGASLTAESVWLPMPPGMSHQPQPPFSLGSLQSLGRFL